MSTETTPETPTPAATPTPPPTGTLHDNVRVVLEGHADRLAPGAARHLEKLLTLEFGGASPALLPDFVKAQLAKPENALFMKPSPVPGTVPAIAADLQSWHAAHGGIQNRGADGRIDLAGVGHVGTVQPGTPAAHTAAQQQVQFPPNFSQLSPPERLLALADGFKNYRSALAATSGIVLATPKPKA